MKWDWRRAAGNAISRNDHRNVLAGAVAGLGGALAIGGMELFSAAAHYPLAVIPFATSIVLVIGSPDAEPAQPRAPIGGHLVAALVRFAVLKLTGPHAWAAAARRPVDPGDVCHRHLSPAGGDQPAAGGLQQPALVLPVRAGAGRRATPHRVRPFLAPLGPPPELASAMALMGRKTGDLPCYSAGVTVLASCSLNCPPSRTSTILR